MFGFLTQYDCSSADINPIGSISKQDLRAFLRWAATHLGYSSLVDIEAAPPTAELEPIRSNYSQVLVFHTSHIFCRLKTISSDAFYPRARTDILKTVSDVNIIGSILAIYGFPYGCNLIDRVGFVTNQTIGPNH